MSTDRGTERGRDLALALPENRLTLQEKESPVTIRRFFPAIVILAPTLMTSAALGQGAERMSVISTAFADGGDIPVSETCQGKGMSPPLAWTRVPEGAKSLALTVDDPDAPQPPFVHWVLYNLPPTATGLPEGVRKGDLPPGTLEGANGRNKTGYVPPCPPSGRHRYFFRVYALDTVLPPHPRPPSMAELEKAMRGHVVSRGELMGTYEKAAQ